MEKNIQFKAEEEKTKSICVDGDQDIIISLILIWLSALAIGIIAWITSKNIIAGIAIAIFTTISVDLFIGQFGNFGSTQPSLFWRFIAKLNKIVLVLIFYCASAVTFSLNEAKVHNFLSQMKGAWFWISIPCFYAVLVIYVILMVAYWVRCLNFCNDPMLPEGGEENGREPS